MLRSWLHLPRQDEQSLWQMNLKSSDSAKWIDELLGKYERFLEVTSVSEDDLIQLFLDEAEARKLRNEQSSFGDLAYKVLYSIGHDNSLYRRLVI